MAETMPTFAQCSLCSRSFPIRAQMNLDSGESIPLLVVVKTVDSAQEALAQATCQVCLNRTGPSDRGLHRVLKRLGLKDEEAPLEPRGSVVVLPQEECLVRDEHAVVRHSRTREVVMFDPLMGTSLVVTPQYSSDCVHYQRPRRDNESQPLSQSRLPRSLQTPEIAPAPMEPVDPLTQTPADSPENRAVLQQAAQQARKRDRERSKGKKKRLKCSFPPSNKELPTQYEKTSERFLRPYKGKEPRPRVVYSVDQEYGDEYQIEHGFESRLETALDSFFHRAGWWFTCWLSDWHGEMGIDRQCRPIDLSSEINHFFACMTATLSKEENESPSKVTSSSKDISS